MIYYNLVHTHTSQKHKFPVCVCVCQCVKMMNEQTMMVFVQDLYCGQRGFVGKFDEMYI